ncbi:Scr1 family TA system antitoxin-like transcriptional regulator [Nocardiopsis sediminis]|uniref:Scr1 family TA system antitoxin-like transcriptional regulator n=1 Tax=Nocardiopsis sediminis TaxID=1778267 RepID=A0ABV8FTE9_9ACTN
MTLEIDARIEYSLESIHRFQLGSTALISNTEEWLRDGRLFMAIESDNGNDKFGGAVRRLRLQAGISQTQLAKCIPMAQSTVSGVELGNKSVKLKQAERLDAVLKGDGHLVRLWRSLQDGHLVPDWYRKVPEMERRAVEIHDYHPLLVPGILQAQGYAFATIRVADRTALTAEVEAQARARSKRQEILLKDDPPFLRVVLDQTVLYRLLGTPEIMKEQLDYLREVSTWERVEILIIPHPTWNHPGLVGGFRLLKVPEAGMVLYQESSAMGGVVVARETVEEHVSLWGDLRALALPPDPSRSLIEKAREEVR